MPSSSIDDVMNDNPTTVNDTVKHDSNKNRVSSGSDGCDAPIIITKDFLNAQPSGVFEELTHKNKQGMELYAMSYRVKPEPKGIMIACHGFAEHVTRAQYKWMAAEVNNLGLSFYGFDHQGHGRSEAYQETRVHIKQFSDYVDDLWSFVQEVMEKEGLNMEEKREGRRIPVFLFGHSMGGGIATEAASQRPDFFDGVILSSPAIKPAAATAKPMMVFAAKCLSSIAPKFSVGEVKAEYVSRNVDVQKGYVVDPLTWNGGARCGWAVKFLKWNDQMKSIFPKTSFPMLILQGTNDKIVDGKGAELLYEHSPSEDKVLKLYEGFFHELLHEPEEDSVKVMGDIVNWLIERIKARGQPVSE
eukprot:Nk52_evm3s2640 gene=Nk52_evmTU3s2640